MNGKDYYKILGISREASADDVKKAHRKLARKHHPDLNPGDKRAEERFKEIQEAYDVLSDPEKRAKYDQFGDMWQHAPFGAGAGPAGASGFPGGAGGPFADVNVGTGGVPFEEFLEQMFGGGGRSGRRGRAAPRSAAPAEDIEFGLEVPLEEAYRGTTRSLRITLEDVCSECEGLGQKRNSRGQVDLNGPVCPRCRGRGRIESQRNVQVTIPAGAWDGLRIKIPGQGAADAQGRRGDLFVQLQIPPHARYERDGQNLLFEVQVPYTVAALGGEVTVETLSGQQRQLIVPPGIQTGQKLRLSGQGMPALQDRKAGDAFGRVKITVPRNLSDHERELLEQLGRLRHDPIRTAA